MYNNTYSRISSLQFGTMSPEEIRDSSVTEITKYQSFKSDGKPIPQGLFDAKMSPTDKSERCETDLLPIDLTPGYFGINNVKHLGKVAFTTSESSVKYMKKSYRISPIGKKGSQYPSCWEMPVKSWITRPTDETGTVKAGKVQIVGVAMGGTKKVRSVKVSVDGGSSWKKAKFIGPNLGKFAWRQFVLETTLSSGTYNIASLASNGSDKQPELRMENRRGYAHNGWKDHSVNITVV